MHQLIRPGVGFRPPIRPIPQPGQVRRHPTGRPRMRRQEFPVEQGPKIEPIGTGTSSTPSSRFFHNPNGQGSDNQCSKLSQNKAGINELPNSSQFIYNLETKTAKKALKKVWKNPEAKKEVLAGLDKMNRGELLPRNQRNLKGFKTLKEIQLTDTWMLVETRKNGALDKIVAIFMRTYLDHIVSILKGKYK